MRIKWKWNSPSYGRLMKTRYPGERDMREHRMFGLVLGFTFYGVVRCIDE